jgi:16S rRNA C1402 (ribose-2'-O) methylase RsmI
LHETLVIGPISQVSQNFQAEAKGEITVVVAPADSPGVPEAPVDSSLIAAQYGCLTKNGLCSRRDAIRSLAKRYGMSARKVYSILEDAK